MRPLRGRVTGTAATLAASAAAFAACLCALGCDAAFADGSGPGYPESVLHVHVLGAPQVGKPDFIVATGFNARNELVAPPGFTLSMFAINPLLLIRGCSPNYFIEDDEVLINTGDGALLTVPELEEGTGGPFEISIQGTPNQSGPQDICAYSKYLTDEVAYASLEADIAPADAAPGAPGAGASPPSPTPSGAPAPAAASLRAPAHLRARPVKGGVLLSWAAPAGVEAYALAVRVGAHPRRYRLRASARSFRLALAAHTHALVTLQALGANGARSPAVALHVR
jgi:hypothetical protein